MTSKEHRTPGDRDGKGFSAKEKLINLNATYLFYRILI